MDMETMRTMQAYGYFFFTVFLVLILYGYIYHLYRSERLGKKDYEKYGQIALNDEVTDSPVESLDVGKDSANKKEEQ